MNIYLDENLSEFVADALNSLNKGYFSHVVVESTKRRFGKGEQDEVLISEIGKDKGFLITRDDRIRTSFHTNSASNMDWVHSSLCFPRTLTAIGNW